MNGKKILIKTLFFTLVLSFLLVVVIFAYATDSGRLETEEYSLYMDSIISYNGFGHNYTIPKQIEDSIVKSIDAYTYECRLSGNLTIPEGIEHIHWNAFDNCTALESVFISSTVSDIDSPVFWGCIRLNEVIVDDTNETYYSVDNCIIERDTDKIIYLHPQSSIPNGVKSIGYSSVCDNYFITDLIIPNSVTEIEAWGIRHPLSLKTIFIPDSVENIEENAILLINNATIYCEAQEKPDAWHDSWYRSNYNINVKWGVDLNTYMSEVGK